MDKAVQVIFALLVGFGRYCSGGLVSFSVDGL